jgi:predicted nucleotidyltransferase component of viral defense system
MIGKEEIDSKASEYEITPPDVERDYVYGWLLYGIYSSGPLAQKLILKGGNAFRKGYFEATRYSGDLDFSTTERIIPENSRTLE